MLLKLQEEIVVGPLDHHSQGRSVVVRPTVETTRANRYPSQAVIVTTAARRLIGLSRDGEKLRAVVVEGTGQDPTVHPEFHEISQNLRELVNKWFPKAALTLLSEAPDLARPQVRHALVAYDRPVLRLDAGTQKTYVALTGDKPEIFKSRVEQMGRLELERLIVRTRFVRGDVDNSKDNEVRAWIRHLGEIRPATVQISTIEKAQGKKARPVTKTRMSQIAELVTEKTGIPVEVQD